MRRLSILLTPSWKFIFPTIFIVQLLIYLSLSIARMLGINVGVREPANGAPIGVYPFLLVICVVLYKVLGTLKKVAVDEDYLYVLNYWKEIKIPLSDITHVDKPEHSSHRRIKYSFARLRNLAI